MRNLCSVATVRRAEATAAVAEPVLMQRAATALAGMCGDLLRTDRGAVRGARVVGLVGSGNNGGDALWALAFLAARGVRATAVGDPDRMHAAGAEAARGAGVRLLDWTSPEVASTCAGADLVLDGIVGIGGSGGLREPSAGVVRGIHAAGVPIVAVDVPSGVDSDTGEVPGEAVRATATACFGVGKPGLLLAPGRDHAGLVTVMDIGLRPQDLEPTAIALELDDLAIPAPAPDAHKYRRGVVGVVAGSQSYPGAAVLAVGGARRAGAGMVAFAPGSAGAGDSPGVTDPVAALVSARYPDVVLAAGRPVDARCVGPGLGSGPAATERVLTACEDPTALVIDASGLDVLATSAGRAALAARAEAGWLTVITPHAGEFARLGHELIGGPLRSAQRAAHQWGCVVVLKGPGTVVAAPDGPGFVDTFGSSALATAGSGDVLAGLLAGLLAAAVRDAAVRDAAVRDAAVRDAGPEATLTAADVALVAARAVGLHGLAGRLAAARMTLPTAEDILEELPAAHAAAASAG